jgi:hypothetical protein
MVSQFTNDESRGWGQQQSDAHAPVAGETACWFTSPWWFHPLLLALVRESVSAPLSGGKHFLLLGGGARQCVPGDRLMSRSARLNLFLSVDEFLHGLTSSSASLAWRLHFADVNWNQA